MNPGEMEEQYKHNLSVEKMGPVPLPLRLWQPNLLLFGKPSGWKPCPAVPNTRVL